MWMPGEALVAPGPARDEHDARPAGDLADRLRHHGGAALLPADGELDRPVVERIERREIAFARHAEHVLHAVHDQLVDQDFAAGPGAVIGAHVSLQFLCAVIATASWPGNPASASCCRKAKTWMAGDKPRYAPA